MGRLRQRRRSLRDRRNSYSPNEGYSAFLASTERKFRARVLVFFLSSFFPALHNLYYVKRVVVFCWLYCTMRSSWSQCFFLSVDFLEGVIYRVIEDCLGLCGNLALLLVELGPPFVLDEDC